MQVPLQMTAQMPMQMTAQTQVRQLPFPSPAARSLPAPMCACGILRQAAESRGAAPQRALSPSLLPSLPRSLLPSRLSLSLTFPLPPSPPPFSLSLTSPFLASRHLLPFPPRSFVVPLSLIRHHPKFLSLRSAVSGEADEWLPPTLRPCPPPDPTAPTHPSPSLGDERSPRP